MKRIFGILSLVVVLAVTALVARKQLQAADRTGIVDRSQDVERKARGVQDRARDHTVRALQQGADRNQRADEP